MLFDPFEKQFDLPSAPIELREGLCGELKIVRQKNQMPVCRRVEITNPSEPFRKIFLCVKALQRNDLIALDPCFLFFVYGQRMNPLKTEIAFGANNKEGRRGLDSVETGKVQITTIHDINGPGFQK